MRTCAAVQTLYHRDTFSGIGRLIKTGCMMFTRSQRNNTLVLVLYLCEIETTKNNNKNLKNNKINVRGKNPSRTQSKISTSSRQKAASNKRALMALESDVFEPKLEVTNFARKRAIPVTNVSLSKCALRFAMAICEPFAPEAAGACIPIPPVVDSQKVCVFVRGTGNIGTGGMAFVAISPGMANDSPSVFYSTTAYTLSDVSILSAVNTLTTGVSTATANSPYSTNQLTESAANSYIGNNVSELTGRVVSAGLTVQYTGTTVSEAGLTSCYAPSQRENVTWDPITSAFPSQSTLGAKRQVDIANFNRSKCSLVVFPTTAEEMNYGASAATMLNSNNTDSLSRVVYPFNATAPIIGNPVSNFSFSSQSALVASPCAIVVITGTIGQSYYFEYCAHLEFAGASASAVSTSNDVDRRGAELVMAAAAMIPEKKMVLNTTPWGAFRSALSEVAREAIPIAVPMLAKAAMAALSII